MQLLERFTLRPARASLEELLGAVALGAAALALVVGGPVTAFGSQPLPAAIVALLLWPLLLGCAWGERGPRHTARGLVAALLEGLGAPRELTLVERDGRRWLRVVVRSVCVEELPLDAIVEVERTSLYRTPHLVVEHEQGELHEPLTREVADAAVAAIERWRREAPPPPAALRCALCHGGLEPDPWSCPGCATRLHPRCADDLGRCPTLGCVRSAAPAPAPGPLELPGAPPSAGDRVLTAAWLAACGLSVALLARGLTGGDAAELVQGGLLGLVTLGPLAVVLVRDPRGALVGALQLVGLTGRERLRLEDGRARVEWTLGRLRLLRGELELDGATRLEVWELGGGVRAALVRGEVRLPLGDELGDASVRRLEALLGRRAVDLFSGDDAPLVAGREEKADKERKDPPAREGLRK